MVILSKKGSPDIKETYEERVKRMTKEGLGSLTKEQSHAHAEAVNMKPKKGLTKAKIKEYLKGGYENYLSSDESSSSDEEYITKKLDPNSPWAEYDRLGDAAKTQPEINANNALLHAINKMLTELKINHIYQRWKYQKEHLSKEDLQKIENYKNPKKSKSSKAKLIKEVKDMIKLISSVKIPKATNSKNLSKAIELTDLITKTPKIKKIKDSQNISKALEIAELIVKAPKLKKIDSKKAAKEIAEIHAEIDKVIKSKKSKPKIMNQAKDYKHKVSNVSPLVENYVSQFKSVLQANQVKGGVMTRTLNDLRKAFYNKAKPSEVDDANALIIEYRSTLPSKAKVVKAKVPKAPAEDADYQKLLKTKIAYIKKNKPSITDPEDIKILADEMIGKKVRSSKKCLEECLNDLGMSGSGIRRKRIKGGIVGGDDDDEDEEEEDVEPDDLTYEQEMEDASDAFMSVVSPMDTEDMGTGNLNIFLNSLSIDPTNPNDRMIGDLYTRVVIPKFRSGFVVEDSASVLYALVNLTRSQRNEAVKMLANALKERKGLTGHLKDLKKHRDRDDDDGEGGGKRHAHHLVRGHGMKFKQALQQAGNEKRLF